MKKITIVVLLKILFPLIVCKFKEKIHLFQVTKCVYEVKQLFLHSFERKKSITFQLINTKTKFIKTNIAKTNT